MVARGPQTRPLVGVQKPNTVEFWYWDGSEEQAGRIVRWVLESPGTHRAERHPHEDMILIDPKNPAGFGVAPLQKGEWLIRDRFGDFFPLPDSIFQATYQSAVNW